MITSLEALPKYLEARREGQTVVYTGGVFDMLHEGHLRLLRNARAQGDLTVVGVMADSRVSALKGSSRPVQPLCTRMAVLDELRTVDFVFGLPTEAPEYRNIGHLVVSTLRPEVYLTGSPSYLQSQELFDTYGTRIVVAPTYAGTSTTEILNRHYDRLAEA